MLERRKPNEVSSMNAHLLTGGDFMTLEQGAEAQSSLTAATN